MKQVLISAFICCTFYVAANSQANSQPSTGILIVVVTGFHNNDGKATVELFNREDAFPKLTEKAVGVIHAKIENNKAIAEFENLPKGEYAVSVYHDENNNNRLDTDFIGYPTEGYALSNGIRAVISRPRFIDAAFPVGGEETHVALRIKY